MATYGTTLTVNFTTWSLHPTPTHSYTLEHGTCTLCEVDGTTGTWYFAPDADDTLGSEGVLMLQMQIGNLTYWFPISFVCNNKLDNSVTVGDYPPDIFSLYIKPAAYVIETQAPLNVVVVIAER